MSSCTHSAHGLPLLFVQVVACVGPSGRAAFSAVGEDVDCC